MSNVSPIRPAPSSEPRTQEELDHIKGCKFFLAASRLMELEGKGTASIGRMVDLARKYGVSEDEIVEVLSYGAWRCRKITGRTYRRRIRRGSWNWTCRKRRSMASLLRRISKAIEPGPHDEWMSL